ncbi:MAG TPA: DedA family protein [Chondromyces sp.]|nr:DedA family protein [Chondromyces sp.]
MKEFIFQLLETLGEYGYAGIALGLMVEVIPSEIVLSYGGYLVSIGKIHFVGALAAGIAGGTLAQLFLYWLGKYGGRPFFQKYGKYLFISERHIQASEQWFEKYGSFVIFSARFIPIVRHAISIPAGFAQMKQSLFLIYTFAAMIPWTILFLLIGIQLGDHWESIESVAGNYIRPIALISLCVLGGYWIWNMKNKQKYE